MKKKISMTMFSALMFAFFLTAAPADLTFDKYHTPQEIQQALRSWAQANPQISVIHSLAVSPGNHPVSLIEIGPEITKAVKTLPAVFVAANMEGIVPLSSEAALYLIKMILEKPDIRQDKTWYILPLGNPDAAAHYFQKPLLLDVRNNSPVNDDKDDAVDEDGPDDLNQDGIISTMRVKDPQGDWMPISGEPRLMKKADPIKGETGIYNLYTEGIDNDQDGEYNEDGPGGVNIGINFPHLFKFHTEDGGVWAGSEEESYHLIKFVNNHREIALIFTFGSSNFCLNPPRGGRKGEADLTRIKIPERFASFMNADPDKTYTLDEIMDMVKDLVPPGMEVTESMIASFLGLGAVVNPLPEDLKFYQELSEKYKEFLKENKLDAKRLDPAQDKDGSFELWAYYQLGLPSFALDFWTLPEAKDEKEKEPEITPDKLENMTDEEFIALGEDKINEFLKSAGAPDNFKAKMVIDAVKNGMMTTKRMAEMMKQMPKPPSKEGIDPKDKSLLTFSDKELDGKGFVNWTAFKHPTLGEVEIGGAVPFTDNTPPERMIDDLLKGQVPWVFELAGQLAKIEIDSTKVEALGGGLYRLKVWVKNNGYLPYPTAMGQRNTRILPIIVTLEGEDFKIIEGKKRTLIQTIPGLKAQEVSWIVLCDKKVNIKVNTQTNIAWNDSQTITVGGK